MVRFSFETEEIEEGKARIIVPKTQRGKGPGRREGFPFYNPVMEVNRDISVLVVQRLVKKGGSRILDGLSGTGIRGIRFAKEVEGDFSVLLNDWNEYSYELILENIKKNDVQKTEGRQEDLNLLLSKSEFGYVDVDPFGTPIHFLDNALKAVTKGGLLAVTATDTAALAGSYPHACRRKYDADPIQTKTRHEVGLRILIGYCARRAAKMGLRIQPLISHSTDHYYRTYMGVVLGKSEMLVEPDDVGYLWRNPTTLEASLEEERNNDVQVVAGPLWKGRIWDSGFLKELRPRSYMSSKTSKLLDLLKTESMIDEPYYSSDELASLLKVHTPSLARIMKSLQDNGFSASPTHFDPKGFRTNAPMENIKSVFVDF
jgi:tRNA (guanine26-N2/guanine27-N2)-dimethyltransferase